MDTGQGIGAAAAGFLEGLSGRVQKDRDTQNVFDRQAALQAAMDKRQAEKDASQQIPPSLYGPMWEKMTGISLPENSPSMNPAVASTLFGYDPNMMRAKAAMTAARRPTGAQSKEEQSKSLAKIYQDALKAGTMTLGGKKAVNPDYSNVVGQDRDMFNTAAGNYFATRMRDLGMNEPTPDFLTMVAGRPSTAFGLPLIGSPGVPERSALAPVNWGQAAAPMQEPAPIRTAPQGQPLVQQAQPVEARVQNLVRVYRTNGLNDMQIAQKLQQAKIAMTPEQLAGIR